MTVERPSSAQGGRNTLTIEFLGGRWEVTTGDALRFGRNADVVIDDNPFMHRVVGRFVHREGVWWLQNHGARSRLEVRDIDHRTTSEAAPRQQVPIVGRSFSVCFTAGPTTYELTGVRDGPTIELDGAVDPLGTATVDFGDVPLSPEQHLLIVALYESSLRGPSIEGNSVIAHRLAWTPKKFNRKLDAVCDKLARAGVPGLKGRQGENADARRDTLVAHALRTGLVGPDDLGLLTGRVSDTPALPPLDVGSED